MIFSETKNLTTIDVKCSLEMSTCSIACRHCEWNGWSPKLITYLVYCRGFKAFFSIVLALLLQPTCFLLTKWCALECHLLKVKGLAAEIPNKHDFMESDVAGQLVKMHIMCFLCVLNSLRLCLAPSVFCRSLLASEIKCFVMFLIWISVLTFILLVYKNKSVNSTSLFSFCLKSN